jgi:UDP-N-acetylglucosamine 2-epimerase (non-hydrolysing)
VKVLTVFGTRPEAIKLAPVIKRLENHPEIVSHVCVTAQHREMLDQVLTLFKIEPHWDLNLMQQDQSLFEITARALRSLERVLVKEHPDVILVQGDTTTAFVASLAAFYLKIRIGHVEAGLRTQDRYNPFPEEMNRRLADALTDFYFAPTETAKSNLLQEGVPEQAISVTGNTVIDALFLTLDSYFELAQTSLKNRLPFLSNDTRIILVTGHRRESFGEGFESICKGLAAIAKQNPGVQIVYPVHMNPNVREPVHRILGSLENVLLIEPLDYADFVFLMKRSYVILTDSGGIQEEAPALAKPVLVMRETTERPEAIAAGTAKLVGTNSDTIAQETQILLDSASEYQKMALAVNPFGDGKAAGRIVDMLMKYNQ